MENLSKIKSFLYLDEEYQKIDPVPKEASVRNYYRVFYESKTYILCIDENFSETPYPFIEIQKYLQSRGFLVPEIIKYDKELQAILLSDVGENDLTSLDNDAYSEKITESIDIILSLQEQKPNEIIKSKSFDYEKLNFELNFLLSAFEKLKEKYKIDTEINPPGREFLDNSIKFLSAFPEKVICHRDFHSRNLMLSKKGICIIDFQDMMMGTPQYDLSSLLYDAYRPLPLKERENHFEYFKSNSKFKDIKFREYYLTQCLQRSLKALGSYIFLFNEKGYTKYDSSISTCLENIIEIIQLGGFPNSIYLFAFEFQKYWNELDRTDS